jgi:hypothetical protein
MPQSVPARTPEKSGQPTTTAALLRQLGIAHGCISQQRVAIAEWLQHNTVNAELKLSLRSDGFGLMLPRPPVRHPKAS